MFAFLVHALTRPVNPQAAALARAVAWTHAGLIALNAVFLYGVAPAAGGGESPLWFNLILLIQSALGLDIAASRGWVAGVITAIGLVLVLAIGWRASLMAALILLLVFAFELLQRIGQLSFVIDNQFTIGPPMIRGIVSAGVAFATSLLAAIAGVMAWRPPWRWN